MAHFYGTVRGSRGTASRLGTARAGLHTVAASHDGSVQVVLYVRDGVDHARVSHETWRGAGVSRLIYDGPIDPRKPTR